MEEPQRPNRLTIVRSGRRYDACGLRGYRAGSAHPALPRRAARRFFRARHAGLLPGATLALIVIFSVYVLGFPPSLPDNPQHRAPIFGIAHYTFEDFAAANR